MPEENTTVAEDIVHRTDPVAGTIVVDNQVITLYYNPRQGAAGGPQRRGPAARGRPADPQRAPGSRSATDRLEESDEIAENAVIRTDPPAGEQVEQATTINLVVSSGPDQQAVPQIVIGRTEADARAAPREPAVQLRGHDRTEETNDVAAGLVIRTNPAAGTLVDIGGQVTLVVSSGAPAVDVPNVVGQTEAAARSQLVGSST